MFLSVFEMFKVGIGPSSSHTMGPMVAAGRFLDDLRGSAFKVAGLRASLHGSLAFTGVGHASDRAVILGLAGFSPGTYDAEKAETALAEIQATGHVAPAGLPTLIFALVVLSVMPVTVPVLIVVMGLLGSTRVFRPPVPIQSCEPPFATTHVPLAANAA